MGRRRLIRHKPKLQMIDNPVPDGLDGRDDPGRMRAPGQAFEVTGQASEGVAAEVPQERRPRPKTTCGLFPRDRPCRRRFLMI